MLIIMLGIFTVGFGLLIYRLFYLQVINGEEYQRMALQQQTRSITLGANRGSIYDTNGNILAQSATVWNVCVSPAQLDMESFDTAAAALAEILDVEKSFILEQAADRGSYYKRIKRRIERELMDRVDEYIIQNKVPGVFFEEDTRRYYKYGSLASTLLGFTNADNQGAYGLEARYESILAGTPGVEVSAKNARGQEMSRMFSQRYEARDGNSIVLTIDESIQHFLERHLHTAVVEHNIKARASGIVMDVKTGAVIAMATKPDFDPNDPYTLSPADQSILDEGFEPGTEEYQKKRTELWYGQWRNKAISDPYEPGSVFKIVTAAAAVDSRKVSLNDHFYCSGVVDVSGVEIHCWRRTGHGQQDFTTGMQNSCNPVFIALGQRMGGPALFNYMQNFGLHSRTGIDLPGEANSIYMPLNLLSKEGMVELSSTSFGQSTKLTPIQMITAASAAVNGGKLMQPYLLKQVLDPAGNVLSTTQPVMRRQVISEEASSTVRGLVEAVVADGSGRHSAIPGFRIGGKTGTSQKLDQEGDEHILSFVGFVPMEDPQYAVLVMLDEPYLPGETAYGSTIAAPVVGAIITDMLHYAGYEPQFTEQQLAEREVSVPDLMGEKPHEAQAKLTSLSLQTRIIGMGGTVIRQIPLSQSVMPKGGTVFLYTDEEDLRDDIIVPVLVGLSAMEANRLLTDSGLNVKLEGTILDGVPMVVTEQWPLPGTQAGTGDIVVITLQQAD
ncbi:MAG: penicillin-binding transpeptidase domain-containing protein [Oscillospiraceae bacterium]|nr:penicillin-binding transpeptidase domain-containing protein [Oscillospiraceae bacterium]